MKITLLILYLFISVFTYAQENNPTRKEIFYLFDKQDNAVKTLGEAATFEVVSKENDTTFSVRYYKNYGPMIWQQTFKDSALSVPNGRFVWYDKNGTIDSTGIMFNGLKTGEWIYLDSLSKSDIMKVKDEEKKIRNNFVMAVPVITATRKYFNSGKRILNGSKADTGATINPSTLIIRDKVWIRYLKENIDTKIGTYNSVYHTSSGNDAVEIVDLTVCKDNIVQDIYFLHSDGYSYDKALLDILENQKPLQLSPKTQKLIPPFHSIQKFNFTYQYK